MCREDMGLFCRLITLGTTQVHVLDNILDIWSYVVDFSTILVCHNCVFSRSCICSEYNAILEESKQMTVEHILFFLCDAAVHVHFIYVLKRHTDLVTVT